jgi:hypothetical protein
MTEYAEDIMLDKKDQLDRIDSVCLPDEIIRAVSPYSR